MPTKDTVMRSITCCAGDAVECHARPRRKSRAVRRAQSRDKVWVVQVHDADIGTRPDSIRLFAHRKDAVSYYEKIVDAYRKTGAAELTEEGETLNLASHWAHGRTVFLNTNETETSFILWDMTINRGPIWGGRK